MAPISTTCRSSWRGASRSRRRPTPTALRAYLKSLDYVGMTPRTVARRLSVMRQFYPLPAGRAHARRRSGEHARFAQARPAAAQGAVARRGRSPDRGGAAPRTGQRRRAHGDAARDPLRLGPARVGAGRPAGRRGRARSDHAAGARQGQQGAAGAARRIRRARRSPSGCARARRRSARRSSRYLFPSRGRDGPSDAPALRAAPEGGGARGRHRSGAGVAARAAPCLRQPSARGAAPTCAACS